jgi:hypothetical protein
MAGASDAKRVGDAAGELQEHNMMAMMASKVYDRRRHMKYSLGDEGRIWYFFQSWSKIQQVMWKRPMTAPLALFHSLIASVVGNK